MIKTKFPSSINSKEYNKLNNELGGGGGTKIIKRQKKGHIKQQKQLTTTKYKFNRK